MKLAVTEDQLEKAAQVMGVSPVVLNTAMCRRFRPFIVKPSQATRRILDSVYARNRGRYAIEHAGQIVLPPVGQGNHCLRGFDAEVEANEWAAENYKGLTNWRVVRL